MNKGNKNKNNSDGSLTSRHTDGNKTLLFRGRSNADIYFYFMQLTTTLAYSDSLWETINIYEQRSSSSMSNIVLQLTIAHSGVFSAISFVILPEFTQGIKTYPFI